MSVERINRYIRIDLDDGSYFLTETEEKTLRAFFLAERDKELGRWRDPEAPDYVAYPFKKHVLVVDERGGLLTIWRRDDVTRRQLHTNTTSWATAKRYFDAHPEVKPWEQAELGELWEIYIKGFPGHPRRVLVQWRGNDLIFGDVKNFLWPLTSPSITSATRLYPAGGDGHV